MRKITGVNEGATTFANQNKSNVHSITNRKIVETSNGQVDLLELIERIEALEKNSK